VPRTSKAIAIVGTVIALGVASIIIITRTNAPSPSMKEDHRSVRYEAEVGGPKDEAGEKRRDYAVLEAALDDLASPKNPETISGPPISEIVINDKTSVQEHFVVTLVMPGRGSRCVRGHAIPSISIDIQKDSERRGTMAALSLADFKPANSKIFVDNLDEIVAKSPDRGFDGGHEAIRKKHPNVSEYLWAHPPGYSTDGNSAVVVFGFPMGMHSGDWVFMLSKKGKQWEVDWRHCRVYQ
jgi:hypothetical protein